MDASCDTDAASARAGDGCGSTRSADPYAKTVLSREPLSGSGPDAVTEFGGGEREGYVGVDESHICPGRAWPREHPARHGAELVTGHS